MTYVGKSLRNLPALRKIGFQANRRLLRNTSVTGAGVRAKRYAEVAPEDPHDQT